MMMERGKGEKGWIFRASRRVSRTIDAATKPSEESNHRCRERAVTNCSPFMLLAVLLGTVRTVARDCLKNEYKGMKKQGVLSAQGKYTKAAEELAAFDPT